MRKMSVLEAQHDEIVGLVRKIATQISTGQIAAHADVISTMLDEMTAKLAIHLALEDMMVCKPMIQSANSGLKLTAAKFRGDVTCLQDICLNFAETWRSGDIAARPQEFIGAFRQVGSALAGRFDLVTRQVYPLAERMTG